MTDSIPTIGKQMQYQHHVFVENLNSEATLELIQSDQMLLFQLAS